ncbi:MAG: tyrosine-type recombinase/integrase [Pseudohongiellaceae bacterium]
MPTSKPAIPVPYFDTLEAMPNPFKQPASSLSHLPGDYPAEAVADYQHASEFIYSYRGSPDTFSAYRREVEHFLHWCWLIAKKSLKQVVRADIESYVEFSRQPPANWVGKAQVPRFTEKGGARLPNPLWRPYISQQGEYTLSQAAVQSLFGVLSSFFNFLVQEGNLEANPVSQLRQKSKFLRKHQSQGRIRRLSPLQWDYVIDCAATLAAENPKEHERTLFIMNALYAMYLRVSELVETPRWQPQMGHFQLDQEGNWWFLTVGKGNKEREISVSDAMLEALKRYRQARGLSALPAPGESSPLIHKTRGKGGITSTRQIRAIVQKCFDQAAAKMRQDGFAEEAERLKTATVHWLRHTGISEDVKHRPREHVRDDAGHGSSAITDRYIDVERTERHATARHKVIQ